MVRPRGLLLLLALLAAPAGGQNLVTSPGPDRVSVTVYRDPGRDASEPLNLEWLNGFALISETRRISLPAGESEVRFEGVAGGMLPQSAIVAGFPDGIVERNRDAYLLSPGTLLDRSLGRRVHLRRTSPATGAVREQEAEIRSGADGAVLLRTADGIEALRCTGLPETLVYEEVPPGLAARPTLSARTRSSRAISATITLSYLATGFDWQADYVATLSPEEDRIDLFAWLTLASLDETSFVDADTQAVAGGTNREPAQAPPSESRPLELQCWPHATTSDIPLEELRRLALGRLPIGRGEGLVVTGSRVPQPNLTATSPITIVAAQQARQEDLGDLKLYRIPEPVTLAANGQKQVALLTRENVRIALVHRQGFDPGRVDSPRPTERFLVARNRAADGLGLPLPAGGLVLFAYAGGRPMLIGEGHVDDSAVGDDVEVPIGRAAGVTTAVERVRDGERWDEFRLTVTNDQPRPVQFEAEFHAAERFRPARRLSRRDGRPLWTVTVPANGTAALRYRVRERAR